MCIVIALNTKLFNHILTMYLLFKMILKKKSKIILLDFYFL